MNRFGRPMNRYSGFQSESPLLRMTVSLFLIMAAIRVITAVVHFVNLIITGFSPTLLMDGIFNLLIAGLAVVCSGMVRRKRLLVIPAFLGITIVTIAYAVSMGRGVNFGVVALAAFYFLCLWVLRRRGEIV